MPTSVGPNTFGEENLVFGYDLGDTVSSYKGEPAYNRHDYDKSVMSQTGFNNWSCYDGNYTASYHTWDIAQSKTLVNIPGPDGKDTNAMLYYNFDGGFYGPTDWGGVPAAICTTGNKITLQAWVKAADAGSVGKTVTPYMYFSLNAGGAEATATNYTLTADWQLISHTHTMSANATNSNNILYFFTQNSGAVRMYLTKTAILSGIGHAVQWLPGGQTRSVTQGLIDLKGTSTIDLTNVSFDSNAQMTFDGTNDYVPLGIVPLAAGASTYTIEAVFRADSTKTQVIWEQNSSGVTQHQRACMILLSNGYGGFNGQSNDFHSAVPYSTGVWYHWIITVDKNLGTNPIKVYVNGTLYAQGDSSAGASNLNVGTHGAAIGYKLNYNGEYFDGDIKMTKVYNRILTASEVKSNFNAIKGRFGI